MPVQLPKFCSYCGRAMKRFAYDQETDFIECPKRFSVSLLSLFDNARLHDFTIVKAVRTENFDSQTGASLR